jgi:hypothetical protein
MRHVIYVMMKIEQKLRQGKEDRISVTNLTVSSVQEVGRYITEHVGIMF